ncbi:hypothetical protein SNEBB_006478 [Seison nebaliae]|nr:hypothetical protein SNEBB_006478 [Seison nebaliae]
MLITIFCTLALFAASIDGKQAKTCPDPSDVPYDRTILKNEYWQKNAAPNMDWTADGSFVEFGCLDPEKDDVSIRVVCKNGEYPPVDDSPCR